MSTLATTATRAAPGHGYLTVPEAAEYLHVSPQTIYRATREGRLKCCRIGWLIRLRRADLDNFASGEPRG